MTLRIVLDDFLTPRNVEEVKHGQSISEASTTPPSTPEGKPRLSRQDKCLVKVGAEFPLVISTPGDEMSEIDASKVKMKPAFAGMPSRGSKNHSRGQCRPCKFYQGGKECPNGVMCNFCHLPHREILRKVTPGCAFLTSETVEMESNTQCDPCLSILADDAPWYIQLPRMHLAL
mmetsp:Transcript_78563/g.123848  ORF Transcript_78563/g.123848 Transcript_78563/m.123848 type:complete len:174 (-) Transcript_78563:102-623(-)